MRKHERELANCEENASSRIIQLGEQEKKKQLSSVITSWLYKKHEKCQFHIHDLEFYDITYNCIGINPSDLIVSAISFHDAIFKLMYGITELTNQQSGGIGFINFDGDLSQYIGMESEDEVRNELATLCSFLNFPLRKGCEKAYVTFNFGLCTTEKGRLITRCLLNVYRKSGQAFPNLVFKVKENINHNIGSPNFDLFQLACEVTAECMNPTFLNMDATFNKNLEPDCFGIMGCRTRIGENRFGSNGALHRGNIAAISINLVQIALKNIGNLSAFYKELSCVMIDAMELLLHRFNTLCHTEKSILTHLKNGCLYQGYDEKNNVDMLKNGTLAIGFIGLWDAVMTLFSLTKFPIEELEKWRDLGLKIVCQMRKLTDQFAEEHQLNISLLASSGEGISGRFPQYDIVNNNHIAYVAKKGFYTNSFHVPVDIAVNCFRKIDLEFPFHKLCNGGHITYIELNEMPIGNGSAIKDLIDYAISRDIGYFGVNYPLDICLSCGAKGTFDQYCPVCGYIHIKRLRRVSGYLSEQDSFTVGKKSELCCRTAHNGYSDLKNYNLINKTIEEK